MKKDTYSDQSAVIAHYDTETGLGNVYKLLADWPTAIKALIFGWENTPEHPAVLHYGFDFSGKDFNQALKKAAFELFANLDIQKGRVLDAGCGLGGVTFTLAPSLPAIQFTGVSLSPGQIRTAAARAKKAGITNVSYEVANYLSLPFKDNFLDGMMAMETFCHVKDTDKPKLFQELRQVLKPSARVAIFDAFMSSKNESDMFVPNDKQTRIFRGWMLPDRISTIEFFINTARKNGFTVIKNLEMTGRILGCSEEASKRARLTHPFQKLIKLAISLRKKEIKLPLFSQVGLDNEKILEFAYTAEHQYEMFQSGDVQYREIVLEKK